MGALKAGMTHDEAAEHLRKEVAETLRFETARLLGPPGPAFFGAVRSILSDMDYVAALYVGAQGRARRDFGQRADTVTFLKDVVAAATGDIGYQTYGEHLRDMFRVGTVHLRAPKQLENPACSTPILSWGLMEDRTETFELGGGKLAPGLTCSHLPLTPGQPSCRCRSESCSMISFDPVNSVLRRWRQRKRLAVTPCSTAGARWPMCW
jgi:hypothetical protein